MICENLLMDMVAALNEGPSFVDDANIRKGLMGFVDTLDVERLERMRTEDRKQYRQMLSFFAEPFRVMNKDEKRAYFACFCERRQIDALSSRVLSLLSRDGVDALSLHEQEEIAGRLQALVDVICFWPEYAAWAQDTAKLVLQMLSQRDNLAGNDGATQECRP